MTIEAFTPKRNEQSSGLEFTTVRADRAHRHCQIWMLTVFEHRRPPELRELGKLQRHHNCGGSNMIMPPPTRAGRASKR